MRKLLIFLPVILFAQEWSGFYYFIFRGDTVCIEPIVIDHDTESDWFSYGSASIHTGFELPYESHFYLFYNSTTGNSGMIIVHNEDVAGTANATCNLYMEDLPFGTSLAISDDPSHSHAGSTGRPCGSAQEFDLACWPQGGWYWGSNTDGGAFYYPATDEWEMSFRYTFGGSDPIRSTWFFSGETGLDRYRLDTVYVGNEDTLYVGHATYYLTVSPLAIDTMVFGAGGYFEFGLSVFNSCSAETEVEITEVSHTNSMFWTIDGPTSIEPCTAESVHVGFTAPLPGVYVDTVEIKGPFNCNVAYGVITVVLLDSMPSIRPIYFTEDTLCDMENMGEFCFSVNYLDSAISAWGYLYEGEPPDTTLVPSFEFPYTEIETGEYCFDWNMGANLPDVEGLYTFRVVTDTVVQCCEGGTPLRSDGTIPNVLLLGEFAGSGDTDYGEIDPMMDYYPGMEAGGHTWFEASPLSGSGEIDFRDSYGWTGSSNHAFIQFYVCSPIGGIATLGGYVDDDCIVWHDGVLLYADTDDSPDGISVPLALEPCEWSRITVWSTSPTPVDWYIRLTVSLDGPLMTAAYIPEDAGFRLDTCFTGIIDTRPPEILLECPESGIEGSTFRFSFAVTDGFPDLPYTVSIVSCGWDTTFDTYETELSWIPTEECPDPILILSARDSFCNIAVDTCEFEIFPICTAYVIDAWMEEETDCNDSNIVEICYEFGTSCPESLYDVSIAISDNGGSSWDVPVTSLVGADEHLFNVAAGLHCFDWIMSDDMPFEEGTDWMLRVELWNGLIMEDMLMVPAILDSDTPSVSISPIPVWLTRGEDFTFNFYVEDMSFELPCSLRLVCCDIDTVIIASDYSFSYTPMVECDNCSLYVFATDTFCNSSVGVATFNVMPIICFVEVSHLSFNEDTVCDGQNSVEICFYLISSCADSTFDLELLISPDGGPFGSGPFSLSDFVGDLGEDIATGRHCLDWLLSDDFPDIETMLAEMTIAIDYPESLQRSDTVSGVLDTRPPSIEFSCPPTDLSEGDRLIFDTDFSDLSSIRSVIYYLSIGDTLIGDGFGMAEYEVPPSCDSVEIYVEVRDTFCNIAISDTCRYMVCTNLPIHQICMPCGSHSSCWGQTMTFSVPHNPCDSPLDEFWGRLIHFAGGSSTEYPLSTSSGHVFIADMVDSLVFTVDGFTFDSGDSIFLAIDSLRSEDGCITK